MGKVTIVVGKIHGQASVRSIRGGVPRLGEDEIALSPTAAVRLAQLLLYEAELHIEDIPYK